MLPWKQLRFKKIISFRNIKLWKHKVAKFQLHTFHKQEIIKSINVETVENHYHEYFHELNVITTATDCCVLGTIGGISLCIVSPNLVPNLEFANKIFDKHSAIPLCRSQSYAKVSLIGLPVSMATDISQVLTSYHKNETALNPAQMYSMQSAPFDVRVF